VMFNSREITRLRVSAWLPDTESSPVEVRQLTRSIDGRLILDRIDVTISAGEVVALLGANGAGKTTFLRCLAGRLRPSAGQVLWNGASPHRHPASHRLVGFAGHESLLYLELTARENLLFAARMYGVARPEHCVTEMLTKIGMETLGDQTARRMSRGLRQRLSLARALVHDPPIVILDEPFSGLDAGSRRWLEEWLTGLRAAGRAILFTNHDEEQCLRVADRMLELKGCRLFSADPPDRGRLSRSA
jgi:heme ABC exporter ATP-binding subunit CcmA